MNKVLLVSAHTTICFVRCVLTFNCNFDPFFHVCIKNPWILIQKEQKFWCTHEEKGSEIQTKLLIIKFESLNEFLVFSKFTGSSFFSNFRTIAAHNTILAFNGEIRKRTSNTWRPDQWCLSSKDLLNDLFQQELHHIITKQRTLSSKRYVGNSHPRHNLRMHHRR